jgi:hypothetical protein
MNNDLERVWKETFIAVYDVPLRNLPAGTEENQEA